MAGLPRVLLVDDDEAVLSTLRRALRSTYDVESAPGGAEALHLLKERGPFAVIVADMSMPGMTGLELLVQAQSIAPDTVRIMMTVADDQQTPIAAVNQGRIFRFLVKPCPPATLATALKDAVAEHQMARHERELLEQTCNGVVQVLTGLLLANEPGIPGADQQLRDRAKQLGQLLKLPSTWELETAALLARLGIATIPRHVLGKLHENDRLTTAETELIARIPEIGARVLGHIPRLAGVAEIFRHQNRDPVRKRREDDDEGPQRGPKVEEVPLASRILRALVDLQIMEDSGLNTSAGLLRLRQNSARYDPGVLKVLERLYADPKALAEETEERMVDELMPGMVLAADAISDEGVSLVASGAELSPMLISRLRNFAELGELVEPLYVTRASLLAQDDAAEPEASDAAGRTPPPG